MKFIFNCVDGDQYRIDFPHFDNLNDILNIVINGNPRWIIDDKSGIAIQADKIISICEARDR